MEVKATTDPKCANMHCPVLLQMCHGATCGKPDQLHDSLGCMPHQRCGLNPHNADTFLQCVNEDYEWDYHVYPWTKKQMLGAACTPHPQTGEPGYCGIVERDVPNLGSFGEPATGSFAGLEVYTGECVAGRCLAAKDGTKVHGDQYIISNGSYVPNIGVGVQLTAVGMAKGSRIDRDHYYLGSSMGYYTHNLYGCVAALVFFIVCTCLCSSYMCHREHQRANKEADGTKVMREADFNDGAMVTLPRVSQGHDPAQPIPVSGTGKERPNSELKMDGEQANPLARPVLENDMEGGGVRQDLVEQ